MRDMSLREQEYKDKGVEILAINAFEDPQDGKDWIAGEGADLHYNWVFADDETAGALGVDAVPMQILLDREGKVAWSSSMASQFGGADAVFEALDEVL